jgi:hypothetical protein
MWAIVITLHPSLPVNVSHFNLLRNNMPHWNQTWQECSVRYTDSDYPFGILWPLCCLSFGIRILITPLVSCGHCVVCPSIYGFWLPLWYFVAIVLSVLWYTDSDYPFDILWPLCCLSFDIRILITPLVSCDHCVVCPSSIYGFWLLLSYLVAIVLSVLRYTDSDYPFGSLWPLCCLPYDIRILITPLVSCGHCVVCPSIYGFWLPLWYLVAIVACPMIYGFWLPLWYLVAIVLPVLWYTDSDYPFDILWPLCCLFFDIRILITSLVSCGHCVVCPSSIYGFWLLLSDLVAIVFSVLRYTDSDYPFGILWPLCCLSYDIRILITPLVSCGHCVFCPSIYGFWLPLWYLVVIVLPVLWYTDSDYPFGILWPLCFLSFDIRILITPLVSCGHCVFCPSIYGFWLPLWYLVAIVLPVLWYTDSDYPFGILWPLCFLSFDIRILITLWYLVAIVLSVLLRYTASDYPFGILDIRILITALVS